MEQKVYTVERRLLSLTGPTFTTFDQDNKIICFLKIKNLRPTKTFVFYSDKSQSQPLFSAALKKGGLSVSYDIAGNDGQLIGTLQLIRSSTFRKDGQYQWQILDGNGVQKGVVENLFIARGYILQPKVVYYPSEVLAGDEEIGNIEQQVKNWRLRVIATYNTDAEKKLNKILLVAIPNLIAITRGMGLIQTSTAKHY